jgi:hypothetical protein
MFSPVTIEVEDSILSSWYLFLSNLPLMKEWNFVTGHGSCQPELVFVVVLRGEKSIPGID